MHTLITRRHWFCAMALIISLLRQSATGFHIVATTRRTIARTTISSAAAEAAVNTHLSDDNQHPPLLQLEHPVILFDGVCNFCNTWVDLLLRIDVNGRFRFAPLQSELGKRLLTEIGKDTDDISSVLLIQPTTTTTTTSSSVFQYYDKSACVLKVVEELGPVAKLASMSAERLLPPFFRDGIYDAVAENRYNFLGKRDECRSGDPQYFDRFLS